MDKVNFSYRDFKAYNYTTISEFFIYYNWLAIFSTYKVNDTATVFNDALYHCINKLVTSKVCKKPKFPQWVSNNLKNLIISKKKGLVSYLDSY